MSDNSHIQWTDATLNIVSGCTKVSDGCVNCYIDRTPPFRMAHRRFDKPGIGGATDIVFHRDRLDLPFRWRKPRRVFVNALADLFHDSVPDGFIARLWDVMGQCPQHTFQILTKRHARMRDWVTRWADHAEEGNPRLVRGPEATREAHPAGRGQLFAAMLDDMGTPPEGCAYPTFDWMEGQRWWPTDLFNVHLGVSVEDQRWADIRIPALLDTPATVRWLSCEPLLGPLDLTEYLEQAMACPWSTCDGHHPGINWVVVGGESGPGARYMDLRWARDVVEQCKAAKVPVFVKQLGAQWASSAGATMPEDNRPDAKGGDWDHWPADLCVREYPGLVTAGA